MMTNALVKMESSLDKLKQEVPYSATMTIMNLDLLGAPNGPQDTPSKANDSGINLAGANTTAAALHL